MKRWIDWPEDCFWCGGGLQVLTSAPQEDDGYGDACAYNDDLVRCRKCFCTTKIFCEDEFYAEADWTGHNACAKCFREGDASQWTREEIDQARQDAERIGKEIGWL